MNIDCLAEICYKPRGERSEDAFAFNIRKKEIQTIAVFDGCGGSGAWKYPEFKNATGAFVAAQSIAKHYLTWFDSIPASVSNDLDSLSSSFVTTTSDVLLNLKNSCAPMGVSGSLVKSFPCTAASAIMVPNHDGTISVTSISAGDSRIYFFFFLNGLIQLTKDDIRGNLDSLESLRKSPPMSNLLSADKPYKVSIRQVTLNEPCFIMCATDGVFGYVKTPMHFELMLLRALLSSHTVVGFEKTFTEDIKRITADDSTCLLAFYGWNNFNKIKEGLVRRYDYLESIVQRIDSAVTLSEFESRANEAWNIYRKQTIYDEMQV